MKLFTSHSYFFKTGLLIALVVNLLTLLPRGALAGLEGAEIAPLATEAVRHGCFQKHLEDAIAINKERRPKYSARSEGESEPISDQLIKFEWWADWAAKYYFDRKAAPYQDRGIAIMCDEFISMSLAPAYPNPDLPKITPREVPKTPQELDVAELKKGIHEAYVKGSFKGVSDYLTPKVTEILSEGATLHCMTRHALESILRGALLAPTHIQQVETWNREHPRDQLDSPAYLSWNFIWSQMQILTRNNRIDAQAFPVQTRWDLPLICGDVPPIPPLE